MTRSEPATTESQVGPTLCLHCCLLCTHLVRRACGWNLSSHAAAWTQSSCTGNLFLKNNCLWPVCCCLHQKIVSGCSLCCCCCRRRCCFCFCCYANAVQIRERTHLSQYPCKTKTNGLQTCEGNAKNTAGFWLSQCSACVAWLQWLRLPQLWLCFLQAATNPMRLQPHAILPEQTSNLKQCIE